MFPQYITFRGTITAQPDDSVTEAACQIPKNAILYFRSRCSLVYVASSLKSIYNARQRFPWTKVGVSYAIKAIFENPELCIAFQAEANNFFHSFAKDPLLIVVDPHEVEKSL